MSKSGCFAVVLATICLSVILLSFVADAQPKKFKNEIKDEIREVKKMIASVHEDSDRKLEDVVQQHDTGIKDEMKDVKDEIKKDIKDEIKDVKTLVSGGGQTNETRPTNGTVQQSKAELVSALVCEYVACSSKILTQHYRA